MHQPECFVEEKYKDHVCLLKKSLYGLKQSPRQWYKKFNSFMIAQDFLHSKYDICVYYKGVENSIMYLLLYVDDILIATKHKALISNLKNQLNLNFEMKDFRAAQKILGMEICRNHVKGKLYLNQKNYILKVLDHFGMSDAKYEKIPLDFHFNLSSSLCPTTNVDADYMSHVPYSSAVGILMYVMILSSRYLLRGQLY